MISVGNLPLAVRARLPGSSIFPGSCKKEALRPGIVSRLQEEKGVLLRLTENGHGEERRRRSGHAGQEDNAPRAGRKKEARHREGRP